MLKNEDKSLPHLLKTKTAFWKKMLKTEDLKIPVSKLWKKVWTVWCAGSPTSCTMYCYFWKLYCIITNLVTSFLCLAVGELAAFLINSDMMCIASQTPLWFWFDIQPPLNMLCHNRNQLISFFLWVLKAKSFTSSQHFHIFQFIKFIEVAHQNRVNPGLVIVFVIISLFVFRGTSIFFCFYVFLPTCLLFLFTPQFRFKLLYKLILSPPRCAINLQIT